MCVLNVLSSRYSTGVYSFLHALPVMLCGRDIVAVLSSVRLDRVGNKSVCVTYHGLQRCNVALGWSFLNVQTSPAHHW